VSAAALIFVIVTATPPTPVDDYPSPPRQHDPWRAPASSLPRGVVTAATTLFDAGLADPRGCEYRAIEIEVGETWHGTASAFQTHGWVLPNTSFAIAWNGLVYRTRSIGARAKVADDVRTMLAANARARAQAKRENWPFHYWPATSEAAFVATESMSPLKTLLLLRLGNGEAAARIWRASTDDVEQPLDFVANEWLWTMYDRGITAHMRGDVALAIESWRRLPALAKLLKNSRGGNFLDHIDALVADERRRAAHPTQPIDMSTLAARPRRERVATLIAALDQVAERQWGQPGNVPLNFDPIVQALVKEGDAAVDPLIAAYDRDGRRTRSVQFGRNFHRYREVLTVKDAAYAALATILDLRSYEHPSADELRAYWQKWRGISRHERAYRMLTDDSLDPSRWLDSAAIIAQPTDAGSRLQGEPLRAKTSPTVSELFAKRLPAFTELWQRAEWLKMFAAWDPIRAKAHVAQTVRDGFVGRGTRGGIADAYEGEALAELTAIRVSLGDKDALADYARWIVTTTPKAAEFAALDWLRPMIEHRDDPNIRRAAEKLFGDSPWVPLVSSYDGLALLRSDLIYVSAFKKAVLAELMNEQKVGTVRMRDGDIYVETGTSQEAESVDEHDPLLPREGTTYDLRVADAVAAQLSYGDGRPTFRRYWPTVIRDKAIAAMIAWLVWH